MNEVVERVKEKYPEYKDVPDDELTAKLAERYPQYLSNASFSNDVNRVSHKMGGPSAPDITVLAPLPAITSNLPPVILESQSPVRQAIDSTRPDKKFLAPIARTLDVAGKVLAGGAEDAITSLLTSRSQEEEVAHSGAPEESNITAIARQLSDTGTVKEPLPLEDDIALLPTAGKIASKAVYGTIETVPRIAAVAGLQAAGVPAPVGAAAVFGATEGGFDPKQAAIAAAIPFVGKYGGEISGAIAKKFGVSSTAAINLVRGAGGLGAPAAGIIAEGEASISQLPEEQRHEARVNLYASVLGQSALGPIGVEYEGKPTPAAVAERIKPIAPLTAEALKQTTKGESSALFQQKPDATLLGGEKPQPEQQVELPRVGEGNARPEKPAGAEAETKVTTVPEEATKTLGATETPPAVQQELVGMGGAVPKEFETSPQTPTSIKNSQVDVERQKRGLPPAIQPARRSFGPVWDEAMAKIDRDPGYPDRLLGELREKPRALTDLEDATILHRQIDLQNEYGKATRDLAQAYDDGRMDDVGQEQARVAAISDQLLDVYNIGKKAGTETGRGLNARKMMAYEDFSLASMELEKRAANAGKPLTPTERANVTALHEKIQATQKAYDEYVSKSEDRIRELEVNKALMEAQRAAKTEPAIHPRILAEAERVVKIMEKSADAARERLRAKFGRTSAGVDPTILADVSIIGAAKIARGVVDFAKWSDAMVKDIGEGVKPFLKEGWAAANKAFNESVDKYAKRGTAAQVKRATSKADVSEQRKAISDTIKERVDQGRRNEISGQVQKLARLLVQSGVKTRDELIDGVHAALREIDPSFTRREAMDAVSGYGDFKQLTKDDISVQLRDLKGQMQQVAKLEDMQAGKPPLKTGVERRIPSPEESRLIKQVNEAKNRFQIPITDDRTQLKSSLDTLKTRLKNRTLELQDKLSRGDFAKKEKRVVQMDSEANRLHFEMTKAKIAWHEALMKDRLAKRSVPAKILGTVGEILNTSRAIITSLDLSAVLRQGGFIALGHPVRALKAFPAMFLALRSEAGQHAVNQEILTRKNYPLYNQSKLYLSEHGQKLSQMEEAYMSRWADKIPLVAGSQRAYVTFLNKIRADSFDAMAASLSRTGEVTPNEANAISNFINVSTGRGNLGAKENALVGLNTVFFAPRYVASRFQLIAGQPLYRGTARTRVAVAKEYGRFLIGVGVTYALAKAAGATIEDDPRSSDFGKLKFGNTRVDPLAGLAQVTVLLSRLVSGETKNASGKVVPIRGPKVPYGSSNSADVIARFLRSKLSPAIGTIVNLLTGKDVVGKPVTIKSTAGDLLIPLAFQDIYNAMKAQDVPTGVILSLLAIFGMGVQTYDSKQQKAK